MAVRAVVVKGRQERLPLVLLLVVVRGRRAAVIRRVGLRRMRRIDVLAVVRLGLAAVVVGHRVAAAILLAVAGLGNPLLAHHLALRLVRRRVLLLVVAREEVLLPGVGLLARAAAVRVIRRGLRVHLEETTIRPRRR